MVGVLFLTDVAGAADYTRAWLDALGEVRPTSTLLGIPALIRPDMLIEIEAEAIIGAGATRQVFYLREQRERSRGYARTVAVGDAVYVSGFTSIILTGRVEAEGDWDAQSDLSHQAIEQALAQAGATLDDVVRRRSFTVDGAEDDVLAVDHRDVSRVVHDRARIFRSGIAERRVEVEEVADAVPDPQDRVVLRVEDVELLAALARAVVALALFDRLVVDRRREVPRVAHDVGAGVPERLEGHVGAERM
jgi:enamine deaminase RidA (YjgF/YER057c/UK114 family)